MPSLHISPQWNGTKTTPGRNESRSRAARRIVPRRLVTSSNHYHRAAFGLVPPNGVRIHVAGIDLIRDECGEPVVLELELTEPSLYFVHAPDAAERFADALLQS